MNRIKSSIFALLTFLLVAMSACTQAPVADKAQVNDAQQAPQQSGTAANLSVDVATSNLTWVGTKPVGQHSGTLKLKEGSISVEGDQVKGGSFTIDMNSLEALDSSPDMNAKLAGHLKAADFFDVAKFPEGKFEITGIQPYTAPADTTQKALLAGATHTVAGNLTLKGVSKNITFPAVIAASATDVAAKANFNIDRTQWGIVYGNDKSLGDKFIRPEVNVGFSIVAKK